MYIYSPRESPNTYVALPNDGGKILRIETLILRGYRRQELAIASDKCDYMYHHRVTTTPPRRKRKTMKKFLQHVKPTTDSQGGSRHGTVNATKAQCAEALGPPHWAGDIDGKVTYSWTFATPRGNFEVRDYWWNKTNEQSIGAPDRKAALWGSAYCRAHGLPASSRG